MTYFFIKLDVHHNTILETIPLSQFNFPTINNNMAAVPNYEVEMTPAPQLAY
jgi:hypothetical protein